MTENLPLGRIDIVPPHEHTKSRMNPVDALAQAGRESKRAYGLRVPTREEAEGLMAEWETDKDSTDIALNLQMLYGQQFDTLRDEDWRDLAKAIQRYGDERVGDFQAELRRETE